MDAHTKHTLSCAYTRAHNSSRCSLSVSGLALLCFVFVFFLLLFLFFVFLLFFFLVPSLTSLYKHIQSDNQMYKHQLFLLFSILVIC